MKRHPIQLFSALMILAVFWSLAGFAFPIFPPPPLAKINCDTSPGFLGDDSNSSSLGFNAGTSTNVSWDSGNSRMLLESGQTTGTFTSRVIDNSCIAAGKAWANLKWTTTLPFGKEIPAGTESSADYVSKDTTNAWSTDLMGLWRFNETTAYDGTADEVIDSSGNSRHGTFKVSWGSSTEMTRGKFNNAWRAGQGAPVEIASADLPQSNILTYAVWMRVDSPVDWVQIAMRDNGTDYWRLQISDTGLVNLANSFGGYIEATGAGSIEDGQWHHIALTLDGSGAGSIWVDGVEYTGTYTVGTYTAANLSINSGPVATVDEAALWHRVLKDEEIVELYRRGANRVKIQIRNCTSSTCSDNPAWQGPDGAATTYFTELNNNSNQLSQLGTVQTGSPTLLFSNFPSVTRSSRYMQYKFILETDDTTYRTDVKTIGPGR